MNLQRLGERMGLRADDWRKLALIAPIFLLCEIAEVLNYNGLMTLFNQRLGGSFLPYVYMAEAVLLPIEAWGMGALAGRMSKPAFMRLQYAAITAIVLANAAALLFLRGTGIDVPFYYAILFITSNFAVRQQTMMLWGLAVDICPTQQAKRVMPVIVSAATLGGIFGGIVTQLVSPLGADVVYAAGPLLLLAISFHYRKAIAQFIVPLALSETAAAEADKDGARSSSMRYFRGTLRSPFLLGVLGIMTIMPALFFLAEYMFINTAHAHYPDEAEYGRMFGLVSTLLFVLAFLLQLVSGKLTARFGASGMLIGISALFAVFFAAAFALFDTPFEMAAAAGVYMLLNVLVYYSAEPSYQIFYKTLPLRERDGFRYAAQGMASFLGLVLGVGLQLLHGGFGWSFAAVALAGAGLAAALLGLAWGVRQLYVKALVHSVQTIGSEERELAESLRELAGNARAMAAVRAMLDDPREEAREIALDVLGAVSDSRYAREIADRLGDESVRVRLAALRALDLSRANLETMAKAAPIFEDEDPDVRAEAVRKLAHMRHMPERAFHFLRSKLSDPSPEVVAEAVKALYLLKSEKSYAACYETVGRMLREGGEPAVPICRVVGELGLDRFAPQMLELLRDEHPSVRVAATRCLGELRRVEALPLMLDRLPTADQELYRTTVKALADMGEPAVEPLKRSLAEAQPKTWQAAVSALSGLLPDEEVRGWLAELAAEKVTEQESAARYPAALEAAGHPDLAELAALRQAELHGSVMDAVWRVLERLTDERVAGSVRRAAESEDEEMQSSGLEVLAEGLGERRLSQRLAAVLQRERGFSGTLEDGQARELIAEAAGSKDDWWREIGREASLRQEGRNGMTDANQMLGRLGKVVYLKKVPFFANLSLEELGLIAKAAEERTFADGELLLKRGERNDAMYVIVAGNVELKSVSAAGWEATLGVLGPGEVCGAASALEESPSTVTAQAFFGEASVLSLRRQEVTRLVRLYPEIGIGLLRASLSRIRILEEMMMRIDS